MKLLNKTPSLLFLLFFSHVALADAPDFNCPSSPNCVASTLPTDSSHHVPVLAGAGSHQQSLDRLTQFLDAEPRVTWHVIDDHRIQAEFSSRVFGFVDDVTLYLHEDGRVDIRSASRTGYWDMGANRRRAEQLRQVLDHAEP